MLEWLNNYLATHPAPAEMPSLFSIAVVCLIVGGIAGFVVWLLITAATRGSKFGGDIAFFLSLVTLVIFTGGAFLIAVG